MSILLLELTGNPTCNRTVWPPHLSVYDDLLIYKKRSWFIVREITISYNQIARVTLTKGIFFATLEIETTGTDNIRIKFILKGKASQAKSIIDQKIYRSHAKHAPAPDKESGEVVSYEKSLSRLKELLNKERISQREFNKKKDELLKKVS